MRFSGLSSGFFRKKMIFRLAVFRRQFRGTKFIGFIGLIGLIGPVCIPRSRLPSDIFFEKKLSRLYSGLELWDWRY